MTETPPPRVFFRRGAFHGDFANKTPSWHVLKTEPGSQWGTYVAFCGYARSNILGDVKVSRAKTPKKVGETCERCVRAITKIEKENTPS